MSDPHAEHTHEDQRAASEAEWRRVLTHGERATQNIRRVFGALPASPRCKLCNSPFKGWGGALMRLIGRRQSRKNPNYCEPCAFQLPGGAEVALSMLFADVRGSTVIAEGMHPVAYSRLIERFYAEATDVLVGEDGLIDRLVGDQVVALFVSGFGGPQHARRAVRAAQRLRQRAARVDQRGALLPIGIGVHTGRAFVGIVQSTVEGLSDFTMLGDDVNVTARLASAAAAGEILVSDAAFSAAGLDLGPLPHRDLDLKGKSQPVGVHVITAAGVVGR
jgi:adenylate cyclase